jgi:hypothetical protein
VHAHPSALSSCVAPRNPFLAQDHIRGRRHLKNVERQQAQEAATAAAIAAAAAAAEGQLPPLPPNITPTGGPFAQAASACASPAPPSGGGGGAPAPLPLQRSTSGIALGADGLRLSDGALLSAGSLTRLPSGDAYDALPCLRVGDVLLPSSMDLRAFLGGWRGEAGAGRWVCFGFFFVWGGGKEGP